MSQTYKIHHGSNLDILPTLPDNSVDSIVTDPPYELGFMGKSWDSTGIAYNVEMWKQCLRVLKPGGHLVAFSGSRTYHRMAVAIEDAGFQIRDQMMWVYGSGFPKSHNIGKAVDKLQGNEREIVGELKAHDIRGGALMETSIPEFKKDISTYQIKITKGTSDWEGWGTALKPAHEPIVLARKPIDGTIAENVLKWGVGGLNIDACRVEAQGENFDNVKDRTDMTGKLTIHHEGGNLEALDKLKRLGRFPANFMHDGSQEVLELFPNDAGRFFYCPKANKKDRDEGCDEIQESFYSMSGNDDPESTIGLNRQIKRKNSHPTVKPTELMRYLCRLVTPPNGTVIDPFNGSGSTGKASVLEGFNYIGIELDPEYIKISEARINAVL
jgi:DNA modification methylase